MKPPNFRVYSISNGSLNRARKIMPSNLAHRNKSYSSKMISTQLSKIHQNFV